jgi:citrate synthase
LRWGEPVLDSAITEIREDGPWYRGRSACAWAREGATFEEVAGHLWQTPLRWSWSSLQRAPRLAEGLRPIDAIAIALPQLAIADASRHVATEEATLAAAQRLVPGLVQVIALSSAGKSRARRAAGTERLAEALAIALGLRPSKTIVKAIDAALVVSADHELNPSSFAARVAASAGADLHACLSAATATLSGPYHGGQPERIGALLDEIARPERAATVVQSRLRRGDVLPGFGHPLYPGGDPRFEVLFETAQTVGRRRRRLAVIEALIGATDLAGAPAPNYDMGTTALAAALGLGPESATALFAVGRSAGWVAHVVEQRQAGHLLRPRARYIGP